MQNTERLAHEDVGYMTFRDFNRARWAHEYAMRFLPWLRVAGYVRFEQEDVRVQSSSDSPVGIPPTKLAYMEISRLMGDLNKWRELEEAANDIHGQLLLHMFGFEMSSAVARWPMEDRPHKVDSLRCGGCKELALMYRPPRFEGDVIRVDCKCGYVLDEEQFTWAIDLIEREERERQLGERGRGRK